MEKIYKRKIRYIILALVALLFMGIGSYILYINNNGAIFYSFFDQVLTEVEDNYLYNFFDNDFKNISIDNNLSIVSSSTDTDNDLLNKLSNIKANIKYQKDIDNKKLYININSKRSDESFLQYKYYVENNTAYTYVDGVSDSYINLGNSVFFEAVNKQYNFNDDYSYLKKFILKSFTNNLKKDDFSKEIEELTINSEKKRYQKITLSLDKEELARVYNQIIKDINKDTRAKNIVTIVNKDLLTKKYTKKNIDLFGYEDISLSLYLDNITYKSNKYEVVLNKKNKSRKYSCFKKDDGVTKLYVYDDEEVISDLDIKKDDDTLTIDVYIDGANRGTILISKTKNSYKVDLDVSKDNYKYVFSYDIEKINTGKKNSYDYKNTIFYNKLENNKDILKLKITNSGTVNNKFKIRESIDNVTLASDIDDKDSLRFNSLIKKRLDS